MSTSLAAAFTHGEQFRLIPIERLAGLKEELRAFRESEPLNTFQRWIVDDHYRLDVPPSDFPVRSILLVAIPHPPYATVELRRHGELRRCLSLVQSDFEATTKDLGVALGSLGFRVAPALDLPLKRLAARSGLAAYGRNNICYAEGLGSHFSLAAYFSDIPCGHEPWAEIRPAPACDRCTACLRSCPTGAIREGRFLIDNERCLSFLNERAEDFPAWLPAEAHHALYDCLACQRRCPMNRKLADRVVGPVLFDEEETEALWAGVPVDELPPALQRKARTLGLHQWPPQAIARNVRALFERPGDPEPGGDPG
jgi:epoxyqueuosine reductase